MMPQSQKRRTVTAPLSRHQGKATPLPRWCILMIMLTPLAVVFSGVSFIRFYNTLLAEEEQKARHAEEAIAEADTSNRNTEQHQLRRDLRPIVRKHKSPEVLLVENQSDEKKEILVMSTNLGEIRMVLRPDLSEGSVDYIRQIVKSGKCNRCNLYRAERPGILQGVVQNKDVPLNTQFGGCPAGLESIPNACPAWDKDCGCHGPIMTRGAVGWAAGMAGGPDFFFDTYQKPAQWWGTQHTNWAFIEDKKSFQVINQIWTQPVTERGGLHHLNNPIHFDLSIEIE